MPEGRPERSGPNKTWASRYPVTVKYGYLRAACHLRCMSLMCSALKRTDFMDAPMLSGNLLTLTSLAELPRCGEISSGSEHEGPLGGCTSTTYAFLTGDCHCWRSRGHTARPC